MKASFIPSIVLLALVATSSAAARVLGRYGQTIEDAKIYKAPTTRARVFYRAKPYEYLCVNWTNDKKWLKVLMSNGSQGYVEASNIAILPYEVTIGNADRSGRVTSGSASRGSAARWGLNFVGTPYKWGGTNMSSGIDCSAFVQKLYGSIGLNLPRTAAEQALVGKPVTRLDDLEPGDRLYFWEAKRGKIGHTGLYLGNGYFVHSSSGRGGVATDFLTDKWRNILVAARR
jgi:cell wall-associated NlpC family hydrolase